MKCSTHTKIRKTQTRLNDRYIHNIILCHLYIPLPRNQLSQYLNQKTKKKSNQNIRHPRKPSLICENHHQTNFKYLIYQVHTKAMASERQAKKPPSAGWQERIVTHSYDVRTGTDIDGYRYSDRPRHKNTDTDTGKRQGVRSKNRANLSSSLVSSQS